MEEPTRDSAAPLAALHAAPHPGPHPAAASPPVPADEGWRQTLGRARRWPWRDTVRTLGQRFREDRLGVMAGSLTFTTLISLVPLITVMLATFTAFPVFGTFQVALEKFLLQNLVPESIARPVLASLTQFAAKASRIGVAGLAGLLVAALALMLTIDRTLNAIWRLPRPRAIGRRLLVYWAVLTLGPLLLGASLSLTSWALTASRGLVAAMPGGLAAVVDLLQFALVAAAAACLYLFVPNTHVRALHAWSGALFVAVAIELAKQGLAWYLKAVPSYTSIYGAFATVPILLLWVYLVWVIVLLGAVIAAYAPSLSMRLARRPEDAGYRFTLALEVLSRLREARSGVEQGLSPLSLAEALRVDPTQLEPVVQTLVQLGWVGRLDEAGPARLVLLAEPAQVGAGPLVDRLLLAPGPATQSLRERSGLHRLTLDQLIG